MARTIRVIRGCLKKTMNFHAPGWNHHPEWMILCLDLRGGFSILKWLLMRSGHGI
jgi:hypothetical protein